MARGAARAAPRRIVRFVDWLHTYLEDQRARLTCDAQRLEAVHAGSRRGPRAGWLGWDTSSAVLEARIHARQAWIDSLVHPDRWQADFLARADVMPERERLNQLRRREQEFFKRVAGEPEWETSRPRHRRRRERTKARRTLLQRHAVGTIDRNAIYDRDAGRCFFCGGQVDRSDFHLHHIDPPPHAPHCAENLAVSHPVCNVRHGDPRHPRHRSNIDSAE